MKADETRRAENITVQALFRQLMCGAWLVSKLFIKVLVMQLRPKGLHAK